MSALNSGWLKDVAISETRMKNAIRTPSTLGYGQRLREDGALTTGEKGEPSHPLMIVML
jgi:hypothetical protein